MSILCQLGMHKWGKPKMTYIYGSNVKDFEASCERCGKKKRWNEIVKSE